MSGAMEMHVGSGGARSLAGLLPQLASELDGSLVLAAAPAAYATGRLVADGSVLVREADGADERLDLDSVFDVRVIHESVEVRWVRQGSSGRVAVLTESESNVMFDAELSWSVRPVIERSPVSYLLWGTGIGKDGWVDLREARTATLTVPLAAPGPTGGSVELHGFEYFGTVDESHGLVGVIAERLTGLRWATAGAGEGARS